MKRTCVRIAAIVLALVLCLPLAPPVRAARVNQEGDVMIRVGLASTSAATGNRALAAAHLQNSTGYGQGYRFGYYDDSLSFVELARTDATVDQIAVVKTQNMYYGYDSGLGKTTYSPSVSGSIVVGCYHIQLPGTYDSAEGAAAAAGQYEGGFPAYIGGTFQARVGAYTSQEAAESARSSLGLDSCPVVGTSSFGLSVVKTGTAQILFQYDDASRPLGINPDVTGVADHRTWFAGYRYRGGFTYRRISGGNITVVNVVELEDYVKGVVCFEMGRSWPLEALKTQAICARTYVLSKLNTYSSLGFDVSNTAYSQVYNGLGTGQADTGPSDISDRACEETRGLVVRYNGKLVETPYSSSHGGASEDARYVWGTDTDSTAPYLKGVVDPYEQLLNASNPMSPWSVSYTASSLTAQVQKYGYGQGTTVSKLQMTYSDKGNVISLKIIYANGNSNTFTPRSSPSIKGILNLRSIRFIVNGQTAPGSTTVPSPTGPSGGTVPGGDGTVPPTGSGTTGNTGTGGSGETGTVTPNVSEPARPQNPGESHDVMTSGGPQTLNGLEGSYTISGKGTIAPAGSDPYTITGEGSTTPAEGETRSDVRQVSAATSGAQGANGTRQVGSGTVLVVGDRFVIEGGGWGHQVGMSQWGANAMARQGFPCDQIVKFYFPGVDIVAYS